MTKVTLCYTAHNADSDWLEKEYMLDEINYIGCINEYVELVRIERKRIDMKWEDDLLYLNFRMDRTNPILFRLIDQYMECFD
jgi:bisphosphoglycerate-independent phosphoglycerate mutase (AlkP superfamily)